MIVPTDIIDDMYIYNASICTVIYDLHTYALACLRTFSVYVACIYIYTYPNIKYWCIYIHKSNKKHNIGVDLSVHMYIYIHMYIHMYTCIYMYIHMYM